MMPTKGELASAMSPSKFKPFRDAKYTFVPELDNNGRPIYDKRNGRRVGQYHVEYVDRKDGYCASHDSFIARVYATGFVTFGLLGLDGDSSFIQTKVKGSNLKEKVKNASVLIKQCIKRSHLRD